MGREDPLSHPHYQNNETRVIHREEVLREMNKIIGARPKAYLLENLEKIEIPAGPGNTLKEAFQDPQVKVCEISKIFEDDLKMVSSPLHLSASPLSIRGALLILESIRRKFFWRFCLLNGLRL